MWILKPKSTNNNDFASCVDAFIAKNAVMRGLCDTTNATEFDRVLNCNQLFKIFFKRGQRAGTTCLQEHEMRHQ